MIYLWGYKIMNDDDTAKLLLTKLKSSGVYTTRDDIENIVLEYKRASNFSRSIRKQNKCTNKEANELLSHLAIHEILDLYSLKLLSDIDTSFLRPILYRRYNITLPERYIVKPPVKPPVDDKVAEAFFAAAMTLPMTLVYVLMWLYKFLKVAIVMVLIVTLFVNFVLFLQIAGVILLIVVAVAIVS